MENDEISTAFNIFMNLQFNNLKKRSLLFPTSKAGDDVKFESLMDLLICLIACSAENSKGGHFKTIKYQIN